MQAIKLFRVDPSHEIQGLDMVKHNEPAYPLGMTSLSLSLFVCLTKSHSDAYVQDKVKPEPIVGPELAKPLDILQPGWLTGEKEIPPVNNVVKSQP